MAIQTQSFTGKLEIDPQNITLVKGASFYQLARKLDQIPADEIDRYFNKILETDGLEFDSELAPLKVFQEAYTLSDDNNILVSYLIFRRRKSPSFIIKDSSTNPLDEYVFAYLFLFEYNGFAAISKNQAMVGVGPAFNRVLVKLPYKRFTRALLQNRTLFKEVKMKNTGSGKNAVRRKVLSGQSLGKTQSPYKQYKYAVSGFQIKNDSDTFTITPSTARITKRGSKESLENTASWIAGIIDEMVANKDEIKSMLDNSPIVVSYNEIKDSLPNPSSVTIELRGVFDYVEAGLATFKHNNTIISYDKFMESWNQLLSNSYKLEKHQTKTATYYALRGAMDVPLEFDKNIRLKLMKRGGFQLLSTQAQKFEVKLGDGKFENFQDVINGKGTGSSIPSFIVEFQGGEYTFLEGEFFKIDYFKSFSQKLPSLLLGRKELGKTISEKGTQTDYESYTDKRVEFPPDSVFHFVEKTLFQELNLTFLACDDLGDEWADFIGLSLEGNASEIYYFHCKASKKKDGGLHEGIVTSKFGDVFSQVQKNTGNLKPTKKEISTKVKNLKDRKYYNFPKRDKKSSNVSTRIPRLRSKTKYANDNEMFEEFRLAYTSLIENPNTRYNVRVVVNFMRVKKVLKEVDHLKLNSKTPRGGFKQLLWQVSQIVSNLHENIPTSFKILCLE